MHHLLDNTISTTLLFFQISTDNQLFGSIIIHSGSRNIIHGIREQRQLDEAPSAYKDIDLVMANQRDLVEPLVELSPIAVIKGD
jgi:hypothetical protein